MPKNIVDIITLGCSKNLVDSETLMGMFAKRGFHCVHDSKNPKGDIVVINTCGFIEDAKRESIDTILRFALAKEEGRIRKLFVMGCLSQRYRQELEAEIPQVDKYYGKFDYRQLIDDLGNAPDLLCESEQTAYCHAERKLTTPRHYAYVKISEGCDRHCAYCAIPIITGHHKSRPQEEIIAEVKNLAEKGVKEIQLIAQDLTAYGTDIYGKQCITSLVGQLADIDKIKLIRLHYAYPSQFPWDLLKVIKERNNVCKYLDVALQHVSDSILSRMRRHQTKEETYRFVERIRSEVPGIYLRTTLMVGFPGETDDDFSQLTEFTRWARFERMGAFAYSEEEGTYSAINYKDDVPQEVKRKRLDDLMAIQQEISAEIHASEVGKRLKVIVDRKEGNYYVARSEYSSPEVDPEILIPVEDRPLRVGSFYNVEIVGSEEFDLYAKVVRPNDKINI